MQLHDVVDQALLLARVHGGEVLQMGGVEQHVAEIHDIARHRVGEAHGEGFLVARDGAVKGDLAQVYEVIAYYAERDQRDHKEDRQQFDEKFSSFSGCFGHNKNNLQPAAQRPGPYGPSAALCRPPDKLLHSGVTEMFRRRFYLPLQPPAA